MIDLIITKTNNQPFACTTFVFGPNYKKLHLFMGQVIHPILTMDVNTWHYSSGYFFNISNKTRCVV